MSDVHNKIIDNCFIGGRKRKKFFVCLSVSILRGDRWLKVHQNGFPIPPPNQSLLSYFYVVGRTKTLTRIIDTTGSRFYPKDLLRLQT